MKKEEIDDDVNKYNLYNYQQRKVENNEHKYFSKPKFGSGHQKQQDVYEHGVLCIYDCLAIMGQ